jgi:hypothetical protein
MFPIRACHRSFSSFVTDPVMKFTESFNSADRSTFLEFIYILTILLLLSAVALTPVFIRHHFLVFKKFFVQEDILEAFLIIIQLLIAYLLSSIYKKELKKYRQKTRRLSGDNRDLSSKLTDAFKYIGGVNVQIHEIRSIFCGLRRYPTTENEFKKALVLFAQTVLGIVNADWVLIRIIQLNKLRTLKEHLEYRVNKTFSLKGISNKAIAAERPIDGYSLVLSRRDNSTVMAVCVFPKDSIDEEENILVETICRQIEMLYLIFISRLYMVPHTDQIVTKW